MNTAFVRNNLSEFAVTHFTCHFPWSYAGTPHGLLQNGSRTAKSSTDLGGTKPTMGTSQRNLNLWIHLRPSEEALGRIYGFHWKQALRECRTCRTCCWWIFLVTELWLGNGHGLPKSRWTKRFMQPFASRNDETMPDLGFSFSVVSLGSHSFPSHFTLGNHFQ